MLEKIFRINHDCFRIEGDVVIYTDPFHIPDGLPKADIVLISHDHYDHCSWEDVAKIIKEETSIVATEACRQKLQGDVNVVRPGDRLTIRGVSIEVVPAYNTNKQFHPKSAGYVGYIFTIQGTRIYFAGDTDYIPEMKNIRCDIALLPVSGIYVMNSDEAATAATEMNPKVVIPMHYADIVGSVEDAKNFKKKYKGETAIK